MNIGVIGCGYVGLVTGTCVANKKNKVAFYDISAERIESLKNDDIYIFEPGLSEIFLKSKNLGLLSFCINIEQLIKSCEVIIVAVNTPPKSDGQCDTNNLMNVIATLIESKNINNKAIIIKSTISIGTTNQIYEYIKKSNKNIDLFYNPEFLSQGNAVNDFLKPNKIVVGNNGTNCFDLMYEIYSNCNLAKEKFIFTNYETAELIKYSCNCFLALRISYINLISQIASVFKADISSIEKSMKADPRIGEHYLSSGLGFGGSCLYKDLKALEYTCKQNKINSNLLGDIIEINDKQVELAVEKIKENISSKEKIIIFGLAFKGNTNDTRYSQGINLIIHLFDLGYNNIHVYEPLNVKSPELDVFFVENIYSCVENAEAIIICNNNDYYNDLDWDKISAKLKGNKIFDFRNLLDKTSLENKNLKIIGFNED